MSNWTEISVLPYKNVSYCQFGAAVSDRLHSYMNFLHCIGLCLLAMLIKLLLIFNKFYGLIVNCQPALLHNVQTQED